MYKILKICRNKAASISVKDMSISDALFSGLPQIVLEGPI